MIRCRLHLRVSPMWSWFYLPGIQTMALLGMEPDEEKLLAAWMRWTRIVVEPTP